MTIHTLQVTTTWPNGAETVEVVQYTQGDLEDAFKPESIAKLAAGLHVIIVSNFGTSTEYVDLQAFYRANLKV